MTDITVQNHGSIVLLVPETDAGRAWLDENIGESNGYQPQWPTALVEPRYAGAILEGMDADGLIIEGAGIALILGVES